MLPYQWLHVPSHNWGSKQSRLSFWWRPLRGTNSTQVWPERNSILNKMQLLPQTEIYLVGIKYNWFEPKSGHNKIILNQNLKNCVDGAELPGGKRFSLWQTLTTKYKNKMHPRTQQYKLGKCFPEKEKQHRHTKLAKYNSLRHSTLGKKFPALCRHLLFPIQKNYIRQIYRFYLCIVSNFLAQNCECAYDGTTYHRTFLQEQSTLVHSMILSSSLTNNISHHQRPHKRGTPSIPNEDGFILSIPSQDFKLAVVISIYLLCLIGVTTNMTTKGIIPMVFFYKLLQKWLFHQEV